MKSRSLHKLLLLATAAIPFNAIKADSPKGPALVINEIMTANVDVFLDPSMNYGSWIEIYNQDSVDIDISGWYLSNDSTNNLQYPLGNRTRKVKAKGFLTLWFGHYDDYCLDQIDMSLSYDGGVVMLSDKDGNIICKASYGVIPARISYARKTDGADEWGLTGNPTPGKTNASSVFASEQLPAPVVSVDSRLFTEQFYFNVTIPEGATLYYTKDGSTPTPANPNVKTSSGAHTVSDTKVYRFRLYKDGMLPSPVTTRSYICTSNQYGVPVVSIVTEENGLYSTEYGMWAKGPYGKSGNGQTDLCNWNRDWDRAANVEIIDVDGKMIINQEVDITPSGRWSRGNTPHPFKMDAKKKFGYDNYFAFTPFADKPYNKYQSLKMRSGGNNLSSRLKDAALQQILIRSGLNIDCQSYQPVHHYINGVYQGVINIREPNNKDFAYSNYGYDEDEVDCFKLDHNFGNGGFVLTEGSRDPWDEWVRLSKTAAQKESYDRICEIVDIDEFINYMCVEFILANQDWPRNNIKSFRLSSDGRFRFVVFDLDHSFGSVSAATDLQPFTFFDSEEYYSGDKTGYKSSMVTLFHNMLKNDTFRKRFIDSFCIIAGSVFDSDLVNQTVQELATRAEREMAFKNESPWADANLITNTLTYDYRQKRVIQLANWSTAQLSNAQNAIRIIKSNIPKAVITLNDIVIPTGKLNGRVIMPAKIKATAPNGYTFAGWKNGNDQFVSTEPEYDLSVNSQTVIAWFTADSEIERPIRINEISADNEVFVNEAFKKHDWIELYNTTSRQIDASGMYLSDNLSNPEKYALPQGTVIPANGYLVIWCDKENGTQLHAPFKLDNKDGSAIVLTARDHSWADTLIYKTHTGFQSIGLYPDGGSTSYVMNRPSIGNANGLNSYDTIDRLQITAVRHLPSDRKSETIYNLLGQPVKNPEPGQLYIRDGKKFFYKP